MWQAPASSFLQTDVFDMPPSKIASCLRMKCHVSRSEFAPSRILGNRRKSTKRSWKAQAVLSKIGHARHNGFGPLFRRSKQNFPPQHQAYTKSHSILSTRSHNFHSFYNTRKNPNVHHSNNQQIPSQRHTLYHVSFF